MRNAKLSNIFIISATVVLVGTLLFALTYRLPSPTPPPGVWTEEFVTRIATGLNAGHAPHCRGTGMDSMPSQGTHEHHTPPIIHCFFVMGTLDLNQFDALMRGLGYPPQDATWSAVGGLTLLSRDYRLEDGTGFQGYYYPSQQAFRFEFYPKGGS